MKKSEIIKESDVFVRFNCKDNSTNVAIREDLDSEARLISGGAIMALGIIHGIENNVWHDEQEGIKAALYHIEMSLKSKKH